MSTTEEEAMPAQTAAPADEWEVERTEPLPKRLVLGRESRPNPYLDVVKESYDEVMQKGDKADGRAVYATIDKAKTTVRTQTRKDKKGNVIATQWQQHPAVAQRLYFLRQAALKHDIGVRIIVDYDTVVVPSVTTKVTQTDKDGNVLKNADGTPKQTEMTFKDVTLHTFKTGSGDKRNKVRISFVGQKKKDVAKKKDATPEQNDS